MISFDDIEAARQRIGDRIFVSPCAYSETLSRLTRARVYLKLENLQMTGSFKERGAANKVLSLTAEERARGVIAASAGNHAQGVAYSAQRLGVDATIVMPETTPLIKVQNTRALGARVVLHGVSYDDAADEALRIAEIEHRVLIHPFNDPLVMAGQGTIGLELLEQNPYLEAVVVPIGGGGLAAGVAVALKETNPRIKVYGVQTAALPSMQRAVAAGSPVALPPARTLADGIAVKRAGDLTLAVIQRYVDAIVTVDEEELSEAILILLEREKTVAEGAGAAPLAALLHQKLPVEGKRTALIISGGNIDVNFMSRIIERGLVKRGRLMRLRTLLPDVAGSLAGLLSILARSKANVVEIDHDRAFGGDLGQSAVDLVLETRGFEHVQE
ncbi:MAG: threonine ammonia-lyase, partial [Myxococcales bacterium]